MPYTTPEEVTEQASFGWFAEAGVNEEKMETAIHHTSSNIDAFIEVRYPVPVPNPSDMLRKCASVLAANRLLVTGQIPPRREKEAQYLRESAVKWQEWLNNLAQGKVKLPEHERLVGA